LLFGSEIKALLAVAPELKETDPEGLLQFFNFGYIADPLTAFRRIRKLPPGHLLEFTEGRIDVRQYWDLPAYGTREFGSEDECLDELEERLAEAVRIRLISDVPLGALLSGGVDSSTVVALMARASSKPVKTFSIGFRNHTFNEGMHARAVAKQFGTEHHELVVEPDIWETLTTLTRTLEEPFADSTILPTYHITRLARQYVTVVLSGDGGDELFAGYERYRVNLQRQFFGFIPGWAGQIYRDHLFPLLPVGTPGRRLCYNLSLPQEERYLDSVSFLSARDRDRSIFSNDFLQLMKDLPSPLDSFRAYMEKVPEKDPLGRMLYLDAKTYLPGDILTNVDRMSMANSLEVRAPILDHVFVEWATRLSPRWKVRSGQRKYLLKKLGERVGVPRSVLYRRKQGFELPLVDWMRRELKDDLQQLLVEPVTIQRGYFNPRAISRILDEHAKSRRDWSSVIWQLLVFELWHRNFLEATGDCGLPPVRLSGKIEEATVRI